MTKQFNEQIAIFFNTWVNSENLEFKSREDQLSWCGKQLKDRTSVGVAAVRFAMANS